MVEGACIVNVELVDYSYKKNCHKEYAPMDKMKNVTVRRKNRTDKPTDLRSEPML